MATIKMLDTRHPTWREELLVELDKVSAKRPIDKIFPLPDINDDVLFQHFIDTCIAGDANGENGTQTPGQR